MNDDLKEQLQTANDMLELVAQQRDAANNQLVHAAAANKALQREVEKLKAELAAKAETETADPPQHANGVDAQPAAIN